MSDRIALALIKRLLQVDAMDADDINAIADELEPEDKMAAHQVRVMLLEAFQTPQSDWQATQQRDRFRVIDGGNSDQG